MELTGTTCPTVKPCVPPENRPSVTQATSWPRPAPMTMEVVLSISGIPARGEVQFWIVSSKTVEPTWSSLGSEVPQHDDSLLSGLDALAGDGLADVILVVEYASLASELESLLAGNLGDTSSRCKVSAKDAKVTGGLNRVAERANDVLAGSHVGRLGQILSERLAGHGHDVSVDQLVLVQVLENRWRMRGQDQLSVAAPS